VDSMLEIKDLTVEVAGKTVLRDVNLNVMSGYTAVLFGPNGSGKSTLLASIMGFSDYNVAKGKIVFRGKDITHMPLHERARLGIGMMMQRPPNIVGVQLGRLVDATGRGKVNSEELAEPLDMARFLERDVNVGFSGGELKRSELLQLKAQDPCLLLLDEPESGVDLESIKRVGQTVRDILDRDSCPVEKGNCKSALVITHTGEILNYLDADRAFVMCNGTIVCSGSPRELLSEISRRGYEECIKCRRRRR
jgi:Fe-S cluster assembly ATP-binding protein